MGGSEDGEGGEILDCSVGTIVWVRRRNGSWWPGRILGPEELAASHLMSPRSGTPVKLLGREDASVDWYNLEKSKRVKSFRCGEFDTCIERAESAHGIPIKKREKYARREDAILHALELEKKQLETKQNTSEVSMNCLVSNSSVVPKRDNLLSSDIATRNDELGMHKRYDVRKSELLSGKPSLFHEEDNMNNSILINDRKGGKPIGLEENDSEDLPRMRGLQDFGLRIAPKKKILYSTSTDTSVRPSVADIENLAAASNGMEVSGYLNNDRKPLGTKRKRSNGGSADESLIREHDEHRPLVQVLQSNATTQASASSELDGEPHLNSIQVEKYNLGVICRAKRSKCIYLPSNANDTLEYSGYPPEAPAQFRNDSCLDRAQTLVEEYPPSDMFAITESEFSGKDFLEDLEDEGDLLGDVSRSLATESKQCDVSGEFADSDNDEAPLCSYIPQVHQEDHYENGSADVGVSNWHIKGKRNVRNSAKKPDDVDDEKIGNTETSEGREATLVSKGNSYKFREMGPSSCKKVGQDVGHEGHQANFSSCDADLEEGFDQEQMFEYSNGQYASALKSGRDRRRNHTSFSEMETNSRSQSRPSWEDGGQTNVSGSHWEGSNECLDKGFSSHLSKEKGSMLFDVDMKVQASYQGEHVPLVCLMSRLNGIAIVGHPVQVEILEDGFTNQYFPASHTGSREGKATQPVWRTGRRTAMQRIPRSNPATSALEDEDDGVFQYSGRESKSVAKKYSFSDKIKSGNKSSFHSPRSTSGKFHKKSSKRVNLASQKTRKLSSIATDPKRSAGNRDSKLSRGSNILGGFIKPEGSVPLITCVPVKVAFSRILEAVGRLSAAPHRVHITNTIKMNLVPS